VEIREACHDQEKKPGSPLMLYGPDRKLCYCLCP
jgi:hypothetical protein